MSEAPAPLPVAILLFPDVEILDFAGPFEVFATGADLLVGTPFRVYTVASSIDPVIARNGLTVVPDYSFDSAPAPGLLVLPGGSGSRVVSQESIYLDWIEWAANSAERVLTVCTGARFAARLGWLDDREYTTHHMAREELQTLAPKGRLKPDARFVDSGKLVAAAGVSAGIDASLYLVAALQGEEAAATVARYMEYPYAAVRVT